MPEEKPEDKIFDDQTRSEMPLSMEPELKSGSFLKNKAVVFGTLTAVILIGLIGWYFLFSNGENPVPTSNNVQLLITGPSQIVSGNEAEYRIIYKNGENADLVNMTLELFYPSGFSFKSSEPATNSAHGSSFNLPLLKSGGESEVIIRGKLMGGTGESKQIRAMLHYSLSNFNSQFSVTQSLETGILPPNLTMDISGPVEVVNGQDTTFTVNFTNVTDHDFDNLALNLIYPDGFSFTSSVPPPTKDTAYWKLPKLAQNTSANIEITGSFSGDGSGIKLVKADLGEIIDNTFAPQLTSTATFKIIPSSLALDLSTDVDGGVVHLGETIDYSLNYINQGRIGLNNLNIVVTLEGPALDINRLNADDAIVSGRTLTWKAATLPGLSILSPNERGEIRFSVPVVQDLNTNLKNQTIRATASISDDEAPKATKAGEVNLKLGTEMELLVNGDYVSGAAPMKVGESTSFNMSFILTNLSNDLSNTKVTASLPLPPSAWKNIVIPEAEKNRLSYDPSSGKIIWNIGDLAAFSGKYTAAAQVRFRLEVTPTEVDRNKTMDLLSDVQATGTDTFTNLKISTEKIQDISTADIDDDVMNLKGSTVQ